MHEHQLPLDDAHQKLMAARPLASINDGFMLQLRDLERQLFPALVAERNATLLAAADADVASQLHADTAAAIDNVIKRPLKRARSLKQIGAAKRKKQALLAKGTRIAQRIIASDQLF